MVKTIEIHSGVRVKIPSKFSFIPHPFQSNRVETMIKRLWMESEASALCDQGEKPVETIDRILKQNSPWKKPYLNEDLKSTSIAVQTLIIEQIDREISCQLIQTNRSRSSSSSMSSSRTSTSNDHSNQTDTTSSTSSHSNTTDESQGENLNDTQQNNNAMKTNIERVNIKDCKREKSIKLLRVFVLLEELIEEVCYRKHRKLSILP